MAMKVTKTAIHRLSVDMSCGCKMYAEFQDAQCKVPVLGNFEVKEGIDPPLERVFKACPKHEQDASLSMLEFIISERLDEAVEAAQKAPVQTHNYRAPVEDVQLSDTSGESVQRIASVAPEIRQRARRPDDDPTKVKTLVRGGGVGVEHNKMAMDMDGAKEDESLTEDMENILAGYSDLDNDDSKDFR